MVPPPNRSANPLPFKAIPVPNRPLRENRNGLPHWSLQAGSRYPG